MISAKYMPDEYKQSMIDFFKDNKNVTFLWKYEEPEEKFIKENIPDNVHLSTWFPQQSLLGRSFEIMFLTLKNL